MKPIKEFQDSKGNYIINSKNRDVQPKMSAGQHNSIIIPRAWVGAGYKKLVPFTVAYKKK